MRDEIHIGDTTTIRPTIYDGTSTVDISASTNVYLVFQKPGGTVTTQTASLFGGGTSGTITFTATSSLWDETGEWIMQGNIVFAASNFKTDYYRFTVYPNL